MVHLINSIGVGGRGEGTTGSKCDREPTHASLRFFQETSADLIDTLAWEWEVSGLLL